MMKNNLKKLFTLGATSILIASLSACGTPDLPTPKSTPEQVVLAVDPTNLPKVLNSINETITKADSEKNKDLLTTRADGPALKMRLALYLLAEKSDYKITSFPTGSESTTVSLSKTWPRVIINVTRADNTNQKYVEILTQNSPKSGFKLSQWMRLLPGTTFPATTVAGKGSELIDIKNSHKLAISPEEAINKWPIALNKGDSPEAKLFIANDFSKALSAEPGKLREAIKDSGGKLNAELTPVKDKNTSITIALPDGRALTSATYQYNFKTSGIKKYKPLVFSNALGKLLGDGGKVKNSASWSKTITVLFLIPKAGSKDGIQILGAENIITDTKK